MAELSASDMHSRWHSLLSLDLMLRCPIRHERGPADGGAVGTRGDPRSWRPTSSADAEGETKLEAPQRLYPSKITCLLLAWFLRLQDDAGFLWKTLGLRNCKCIQNLSTCETRFTSLMV